MTPPATHGKMLSQGWEWFPPQVRKEDKQMAIMTKATVQGFIQNGTDSEKVLALEIERLNKLVNTWRNRVPADKRAEYTGKKVEVKHRWFLDFDGRSYDMTKRRDSDVTCTKGTDCDSCYPVNPYA